MRNWENLVKKYIRECRVSGLVEATIKCKESLLLKWGVWLRMRRPCPSIEAVCRKPEYIINYITSRTTFKSKSHVRTVISIMRCMGEFLLNEGIWPENPLKWIHGPRSNPYGKLTRHRISRSRLKKILEGAAGYHREYDRIMLLTIISLLYSTGMRRGELERLRIQDWDRDQGLITMDGRKSRQERKLPVPEIVYRSIETYLPLRQNLLMEKGEDHDRLLVNRNGKPLRGQQISNRIKVVCKRAGVEKVTMHQFRHTCASDLLEEGAGILEVQKVLGHVGVGTTYRYIAIADPERKKAISMHPINAMLNRQQQKGAGA